MTILATSREVLGLPGEQVWRVRRWRSRPGATAATAVKRRPVQLFVEHAVAARPGFAIGPDNVEDIVEIVRRLDGLPLCARAGRGTYPGDEPGRARRNGSTKVSICSTGTQDVGDRPSSHRAGSRRVVARPARSLTSSDCSAIVLVRRKFRARRRRRRLRR